MRFLLALEQYYMLELKPQNNTLYVANGSPGGERVAESNRDLNRQNLYMYLDDVLIHVFSSIKLGPDSFMNLLATSNNTMLKCINDNTLFLSKFMLSYTRVEGLEEKLLTIDEVLQLVQEARIEHAVTRTP
jgi:hypothetical protein